MKAIKMLMITALTILSFAVFAQDSSAKKMKAPNYKLEKIKYSCPMHSDVTSTKPGKCSKCGMELKAKDMKETAFACPMKCEGDKTYDSTGKCPICGMNLKEVKKNEEKKDDHSGHKH